MQLIFGVLRSNGVLKFKIMKPLLKFAACILLTEIIIFVSCQKEISCEGCRDSNKPPKTNAGPDQVIILPTDSVSLDGSASSDPDGTITSYKWTKIAGPASSNILKPDSSKTLVETLVMGVYKFELTVTDDGGLSAKDTVQIIVNDPAVNQPPIANAGTDQTITLPTDSMFLNGNLSLDPDGTIVSYQWIKISGPSSFTIINSQLVQTKVNNLIQGTYQFELKVTDNGGLSAKDTIQITVNDPSQLNHPPVANAGADQTITLPNNTINLDGSRSSDPENNISDYVWTKISGSASFNITNANAIQTQVTSLVEGIYQFELKVTDAVGLFSKDTVLITVNAAVITPACDNSNRPQVNAQLIPIGTLSQARVGMSVASAGSKVFFAGGTVFSPSGSYHSDSVDIYDVVSNSWSTARLCVPRDNMAAVAAGNKIFFAGGEFGDGTWPVDSIDIYNVSTNTWSVSHLSVAGNGIAAATVGDKVFFAGGDGGFSGPGREIRVDIFNLTTNTWSTTSLSEMKRGGHSAITANDKIYFAGGETWPGNYWIASNKIDIYDNVTNTWSTSSLYEGKIAFAGIAVAGKIYWAGGRTGGWTSYNTSCAVEIMDANTGNSSIEYLFKPETWWIDIGQNAVLKDNKIIFYRPNEPDNDRFDIYDIMTNTWSIGILPQIISDASIISVNNTIYIAGGAVNGISSNQVWKLEF